MFSSMKNSRRLLVPGTALAAAVLAGTLFVSDALRAQEVTSLENVDGKYDAMSESLRGCPNRGNQPKAADTGELIFYSTTWGNNPQEGQYRQEMERLLSAEVQNVKGAILDVEGKFKEMVRVFPHYKDKTYKEIILEDKPGVWRDGVYVNILKVIGFHFNEDKSIDCVILDYQIRNIQIENQWTRKLMRLYYPNIQTVELLTIRHNYKMGGTLEKTAPEIQLRALRTYFADVRAAIYVMDMEIAAYYDQRNKVNSWQMGL